VKWWVARGERRIDVDVRRVGERFEVALDGASYSLEFLPVGTGLSAMLCADGRTFAVAHRHEGPGRWRISLGDREFQVYLRDPLEREVAGKGFAAAGPQEVRAPIPGKVVSIAIAAGDAVTAGQPLVVLEAMKMQNQICAEGAGTVESIAVTPGVTVEGGQVLVVLR
jgi:acetyl/propionyl-CoA carboxylase alpha subunit